MNSNPPTVLLIEDNEDDIFLMRRALKAARLEVKLDVAQDGQEAMDYFEALVGPAETRRPMPDLVLLDLKLPFVHGFEVLTFIRQHPELKYLTVVVLTSSGEDSDESKCAELQAHDYYVKPPTAAVIASIAKILMLESKVAATR